MTSFRLELPKEEPPDDLAQPVLDFLCRKDGGVRGGALNHWTRVAVGTNVERGDQEGGSEEIRRAIGTYRATGTRLHSTHHLTLLAQVLAACGHYGEGLTALREAAALVEETGERYLEAEIRRLEGNLLLAENGSAEAEACYLKALEVARAQEARSLELRAAGDLARLWAGQDRRSEARDLLAPVYGCFTEGFDTADLKEAKALLDELT